MYFVKYGESYLHDPRKDGYILLDLTLSTEENSCGYCDFTIYPDHPMYGKLRERDADNPVKVYDDDTLLFAGFIYELGEEFYLDGHVKCKGDLDYLNESVVRPYSTDVRGFGNQAPNQPDKYFAWLVEQHNSQMEPNKRFVVGINQARSYSTYENLFENDGYPLTIEAIKNDLIENEDIGGYIRTRHENGTRYIDYISEWSEKNTQTLDFGVNLTSYTKTDNSESIATCIIPLGAAMRQTEYPYDNGYAPNTDVTMVKDKEYFVHPYNRLGKIASFEKGVTYYEQYVDIFVTKDTSPVLGIDYYVRSAEPNKKGEYSYSRQDISRFVSGVTYYEQENYYVVTTDTIPSDEKNYYIYDETSYSRVTNLGRFRKHEKYFTYTEGNDESETYLTIEGCDMLLGDSDFIKRGDMIYCKSAVEKYGYIYMTVDYSDVITKEELILLGILDLKENLSPKRTIEIKAVDMHLINPSIKPIRVGEYVRVRSVPHKLDSYFLCASIDLDLNNPENSLYTLGTTFDTLTGEQNKTINSLNASMSKNYESAATASKTAVNAAKEAQIVADNAKATLSTVSETMTNVQRSVELAVVSIVEEYATTLTPDDKPEDDAWTVESPGYVTDVFIWHRFVTTYGDGTTSTSEASLLSGGAGGAAGADGEDAILLRIESSRGTVFKNNSISTVLSVVIYKGSYRITDLAMLRQVFGTGAYLQWYWQKLDDDTFGVISSSDSKIGHDGFTLTINADEVDTKVTFMCELIV